MADVVEVCRRRDEFASVRATPNWMKADCESSAYDTNSVLTYSRMVLLISRNENLRFGLTRPSRSKLVVFNSSPEQSN